MGVCGEQPCANGACSILCFPKALEPIRCELGVANGVLDIPVPEPVLQGTGVDAIVGELVAARMPQHVRVDRKRHPGRLPYPRQQLPEARRGHRPLTFGGEDVGRGRQLFALEPAQVTDLSTAQGMHARPAVLEPANVDEPLVEIELIPAQRAQLPYPEHVPVADENHGGVAMTVAAIPAPCGFHQPRDFARRQVLARAPFLISNP